MGVELHPALTVRIQEEADKTKSHSWLALSLSFLPANPRITKETGFTEREPGGLKNIWRNSECKTSHHIKPFRPVRSEITSQKSCNLIQLASQAVSASIQAQAQADNENRVQKLSQFWPLPEWASGWRAFLFFTKIFNYNLH